MGGSGTVTPTTAGSAFASGSAGPMAAAAAAGALLVPSHASGHIGSSTPAGGGGGGGAMSMQMQMGPAAPFTDPPIWDEVKRFLRNPRKVSVLVWLHRYV